MTEPYTLEELDEIKRRLERAIDRTEREHPDARPLPPMEENESRELIHSLIETAVDRTLTTPESFLFGQLIAAYRMAVEARMLGRKGRYYVVSASDIEKAALD